MKYLGIDYGTKKVGLAMTDNDGLMAFPFKILKKDENFLQNILDIIKKNHIEHIFIGKSLGQSGVENRVQKDIELFLENLQKKLTTEKMDVPIESVIESFTSSHAREQITKSSLNDRKTKKDDEGLVDAKAAVLILERGLERINRNKS